MILICPWLVQLCATEAPSDRFYFLDQKLFFPVFSLGDSFGVDAVDERLLSFRPLAEDAGSWMLAGGFGADRCADVGSSKPDSINRVGREPGFADVRSYEKDECVG